MHRSARHPGGFTLVELLVLITIIGMLMALILPAVQAAREAGRRTSCMKNVSEQALAVIRFSDTKGYIPGWRNAMMTNSGTIFPSWPVMILPNMEKKTVSDAFVNGTISLNSSAAPYLASYVCPSSPPDTLTSPWLSYVGSAGVGSNASGSRASGVMLDTTASGGRVSLDDVGSNDGKAQTLLVSEECGRLITTPGSWNWTGAAISWSGSGSATPVFGIASATVPSSPSRVINSGTTGSATVFNMPNSNHPGGAVAVFCGGNTVFLKESLKANVYAQLMSWSHQLASGTAPYSTWVSGYPLLSEADYQ